LYQRVPSGQIAIVHTSDTFAVGWVV